MEQILGSGQNIRFCGNLAQSGASLHRWQAMQMVDDYVMVSAN